MVLVAKDGSKFDSFGLAVLSHGNDGLGLVYATDFLISIESLVRPIKHCEALNGKPKFFFYQVCVL